MAISLTANIVPFVNMQEKNTSRIPSRIFFDGSCPMCTVYANAIVTSDSIELIDVTKPTVLLPKPTPQLLSAMHLIEPSGTIRTGADAVMTGLATKYIWLKPAAYTLRLPGIKSIADAFYRSVAQRRHLLFGSDTSRLFLTYIIVNFGLLCALLMTVPAWLPIREYPLVPILPNLSWLTSLTTPLFLTCLAALVIGLTRTKHFGSTSLVILTSLAILILLDINRLQPYVLFYLAFVTLFLFWSNLSNHTRTNHILSAARIMVAGIYIASGFQKINTMFIISVFPWFTEQFWGPLGDIGYSTAIILGTYVPFIEVAIGIGLLTNRFRQKAIVGSLLMCILVCVALASQGWNSVVIPWNIVLFSLVVVLFYGHTSAQQNTFKQIRINYFTTFAISLFFVLPIGNAMGFVDHYLAWSLYSGHVDTAFLQRNNDEPLQVDEWTMESMNMVAYPEKRVFMKVFESVCDNTGTDTYTITIQTYPFFLSHLYTEEAITCQQLTQQNI